MNLKIPALDDLKNTDWHAVLNIFLRVMAGFIIMRGLFFFGHILGLSNLKITPFLDCTPQVQTYIVCCSIISIVSGVGLWMLNKWGSAMWLFVLVIMLVIDFSTMLIPQSTMADAGRSFHKTLFDIALIVIYFALSTQSFLDEKKHIRI